MTLRRNARTALVLLLAAGLALAGHALGDSARHNPGGSPASEAAYAGALSKALKDGYQRGKKGGYAEGVRQGALAGNLAGARAGQAKGFRVHLAAAPPPPPPEAPIWAVGDAAIANKNEAAVSGLIGQGIFDDFLYLGDVYQSGTPAEFANNYDPYFGSFGHITQPTPGNHDSPHNFSGYDGYWKQMKGRTQPHWYSFSAGGWQLISLDSESPHDGGSPQLSWLSHELSSTPKFGTCRIAYWHRPRFSAGTEHGDQPDVQPFWDALTGKASLILNGHEHDMQRFNPVGGITEMVAGSGGNDHYPIRGRSGLAFGNDSAYGALRLTLSQRKATYAFVAAPSGKVLDSGGVPCKPG